MFHELTRRDWLAQAGLAIVPASLTPNPTPAPSSAEFFHEFEAYHVVDGHRVTTQYIEADEASWDESPESADVSWAVLRHYGMVRAFKLDESLSPPASSLELADGPTNDDFLEAIRALARAKRRLEQFNDTPLPPVDPTDSLRATPESIAYDRKVDKLCRAVTRRVVALRTLVYQATQSSTGVVTLSDGTTVVALDVDIVDDTWNSVQIIPGRRVATVR